MSKEDDGVHSRMSEDIEESEDIADRDEQVTEEQTDDEDEDDEDVTDEDGEETDGGMLESYGTQ